MEDRTLRAPDDLGVIDFEKGGGLVPVVVQDARSGAVLMVAYANAEALQRSLETGRMHYWSRSRQELWRKGDTSGAVQQLVSMHTDCDADVILCRVLQEGAACHTGDATCFGEGSPPEHSPQAVLERLDSTLVSRIEAQPEGSYTARLLNDENLRLKKLGEETVELTTALARGEAQAVNEAADLLYHLMVALRAGGHSLADVTDELASRAK